MAARYVSVCLPSWPALALLCLVAHPAAASLDRTGLISTVRNGPIELVLALEDSTYLPGQRTIALICVTNRGDKAIPFAPEPDGCWEPSTAVTLRRMGLEGAWFVLRRGSTCCRAGSSWAIPPISPLEPGGSTCYSTNLGHYGNYEPDWARQRMEGDPTRALRNAGLAPGQYSLQVTYNLPREQNHWRQPLSVVSDTLFFMIGPAPETQGERDLLSRYATALDSCRGDRFPDRQELSFAWLFRFSNSRLFQNVFLASGHMTYRVPRETLFSWLDPYFVRNTSRAVLLDLLFRRSSPAPDDPAMQSAYARGDLAQRVVNDWQSRPKRRAHRDSIYAERKRKLIGGWPPYGTYVDPNPFNVPTW